MTMSADQKEEVDFRVDQEGFDYTFRSYSDFSEIEDLEFHRLRQAYIDAANNLENYLK